MLIEGGIRTKNQRPQELLEAPLSSAALKLRSNLESGALEPVSTLMGTLRCDSPDLDTVRVCLESYEATTLSDLNNEERLVMINATCVGGRTLDWLWKNDDRLIDALESKQAFVERLIYLLVAEGYEHYVLALLKDERNGPL